MKVLQFEGIRGFVAVYVVIQHYVFFTPLAKELPLFVSSFFKFGQEAVIIFFLLSGFVIYLSSSQKNNLTFKKYFLKRFIRIYPIAIVSYILSAIIFYLNNYLYSLKDIFRLLGNLFMLQDLSNQPGIIVVPFMYNFPLWSLSYEWWFYMLYFPLIIIVSRFNSRKNIHDIYYILAVSVISWLFFLQWPNHIFMILTYLLLWWTGVESAKVYLKYKSFTFTNMFPIYGSIVMMLFVLSISGFKIYMKGINSFNDLNKDYPLTTYLHHYVDAFIFIIIGILVWKFKIYKFKILFNVFSIISPISYALYIIHFPFIFLKIPYISNIYILILVKLTATFLLAYILEMILQPRLNRLVNFSKSKK